MEAKMSLFEMEVGSNVKVKLEGFGIFAATLAKIDDNRYFYIFDDCIARRAMNSENTNEGGYEASDMEKWLNTTVFNAFPEEIRRHLQSVSLSTAGQIFGHDDEWCNEYLEMDNEEQFPMMKKRQNRVACYNDDACWYWLQNPVKKEHSAAFFAAVYRFGVTHYYLASNSIGVRPVFVLVRPTFGGHVPQRTNVSYGSYADGKRPETVTKESLIAEIDSRREEIEGLKKEIENLEKYKAYDNGANEMKAFMDSFVRAGFSESQALKLVTDLSIAILGGKR